MSPACSPTPINVPIVSNTSMNTNMMTIGIMVAEIAVARSNWRKVGPIAGGIASTPWAVANCVTSSDSATRAEPAIPSGRRGSRDFSSTATASALPIPPMIDPVTRRACRTAATRNPTINTITSGDAIWGFIATPVPGLTTTSCAFRSPMNAMNKPIPTAIPYFRLGLTASNSFFRTPTREMTTKITPATNTAPSAAAHGSEAPAAAATGMAVRTKKKF